MSWQSVIIAVSVVMRGLAWAAEPWDEPLSPHSSFWWMSFAVSNTQKFAAMPIDTNAVKFVIANGQGFHSMNPWVVRRRGVEPQRLPPLSHPESRGCDIRLESDKAVEFLCQAEAMTLKQAESVWPRPVWFMVFCQSSNVVVGVRAVTDETFLRMPDIEKAIDNDGEPLAQSRPALLDRRRDKKPANKVPEDTARKLADPQH